MIERAIIVKRDGASHNEVGQSEESSGIQWHC